MTIFSRGKLFANQAKKWGLVKTLMVGTKIIRSYFQDIPRTIVVEPASVCNLNCTFCAPTKINLGRKNKFLDFEVFKKMIDDAKNDCWAILFTFCGEPFLNKDIYKMIAYTNESGFFTSASTNMTLFNDKKTVNSLIDSGLNHLTVSLDGITKKTYEFHRIGGNFDQVVKNLKLIAREKKKKGLMTPFLDLQMVVTKKNIGQVPRFADFAKKTGADGAYLKPLYIDQGVSDEYVKRVKKELFVESEVSRYLKKEEGIALKRETSCDFLDKPVISSDGEVFACCMDYVGQYRFGNVGQENLLEIWRRGKYKKFRQKQMKEKRLGICRGCATAISKTLYSK